MIQYIKYHPQFHKQCDRLRKSNDKAGKAVDNAMNIIAGLKRIRNDFNVAQALTHSGELRLKDGIKYRLGNGYRLVLAVQKDSLHVLCIGTHDECDKWLERNRGMEAFSFSWMEETGPPPGNPMVIDYESSDPRDDYSIHIEDRILRQIFKGICNPSR